MSASEDQSWIAQDERRMLHAVYRVGNMDAYIKYMQDCFGMKLLRYRDIKEEKYTNAFLGYKSELTNFCLEYVIFLLLLLEVNSGWLVDGSNAFICFM